MKYKAILVLLTLSQVLLPLEMPNSLNKIIESNEHRVNVFDGRLCVVNWTHKLSVRILRTHDKSLSLTIAEAMTLEQLQKLSQLKKQRTLRCDSLKSPVSIHEYSLPSIKKTDKKQEVSETKNAMLAFEFISKTPLWWNLDSFEQLEELCAYYQSIFDEFQIDSSQKAPLLITIKPTGSRCFWARDLTNHMQQISRSISGKSWNFLSEHFYIVQSDLEIYWLTIGRDSINRILRINEQYMGTNFITRFVKSLTFRDIINILFLAHILKNAKFQFKWR